MKLLIAYDGSHSADSALDDVTHAGLPATGDALVMTVAEAQLRLYARDAYRETTMAIETSKGGL